MSSKKLKYLLFISMMALLFLPMWYVPVLQQKFEKLQVSRVVGFFGKAKKPNFHGKRWMSGEYQKAYESYVKAKNPLHPTAIRLKSQMDYSLYGNIMHANILSGKNGFLFQKEGCEGYIGRDFKGEDWLRQKVEKLEFIIESFQKDSVQFLVLTPPLKARIFSEYLPDFYQKNTSDQTNWNVFPKLLQEANIPVLNFDFFIKNKKDFPYAIYPPSGQHWTKYGAAIAADSIKKRMEDLLDISMVQLRWQDSIKMSTAKVDFDNELVAGANFLWNPPLDPLPYPSIRYLENDSTIRPNVLSVGDSFYKLIYEFGIVDGMFHKESSFWYYNHELFPVKLENGRRLTNKDLNILEEIKQRDMVIITVFEENLDRFAFGFVDHVYELLQK